MLNFGNIGSASATIPNNEDAGRIARLTKLQLAASQNRKQENALMVDPVESFIFVRQAAGKRCSCQDTVSTKNSNNVIEQQDDDPFVVRLQDAASEAYDAVFQENENFDYHANDDNGEVIDEIGNEVSLISGSDKGFCAICMNTGWTEGYRLHNGMRLLGYVGTEVAKSNNVSISYDCKPAAFKGKAGDFVDFKFRVPKNYTKSLHFKAHNNCNIVDAIVTIEDVAVEDFDDDKGKEIVVRVLPIADSWTMTHFDCWLSFGATLIDLPPVQRDSDFQFFEALQTIHFETSGNVPYIDRESVVLEMKHGNLWKVSNATPQLTSERILIKTELDARLIQSNELLYYLNFVAQPTKIYGYEGLNKLKGYKK